MLQGDRPLQHHPGDGRAAQPLSPSLKGSAKASPQAGGGRRRCVMEWIEPAVQKTSWKVFYDGLRSSATGDVRCGDVVAVETSGDHVAIKVGSHMLLLPL